MTKTELIAAVAESASLTKSQATTAVNAVFDTIVRAVAADDKVSIPGFGTFEKRHRQARIGRNPRTGEETAIDAAVFPAFKAGKGFKDALKK